jgi:hypothetical protein
MAAMTRPFTIPLVLAVACVFVTLPLSAATAFAQQAQSEPSRWGVAGSLTPHWEFLRFFEDAMDKVIDMRGDEFRVGVIRGKHLGGEWGIAYVKRRVDDDSTIVQEKPKCVAASGQAGVCANGTSYQTRGALLEGVQLHRFFPVATIARRVQIGAVVSGGVARLDGQADERVNHLQVTTAAGAPVFAAATETRSVAARAIFDHTFIADYVPIGGVEAAVAVLAAPGVKLRVSGGASFPGFHQVSITAQYLFGVR